MGVVCFTYLADSVHHHGVSVGEELTLLAGVQLHGVGTTPCELEHGSVGSLGRPADGSRCEQITRAHVASVDGVVRKLLEDRPVHVLEVGFADGAVRGIVGGLDGRGQVDVEGTLEVLLQVRQHVGKVFACSRALHGAFAAEGLKGVEGDDPGGDGGCEGLCKEGSKGHVLPLLDVTCGPVVEERESEDNLLCLVNAHGLAKGVLGTHPRSDLNLHVEKLAGSEDRRLVVVGTGLPVRACHRGAGDDNAAGAAVVSNGEVEPVGEERLTVGAEQLADVGRMLAGGVEVCVVTHLGGHDHLHAADLLQHLRLQALVTLELLVVLREELLDHLSHVAPVRAAKSHELVQGVGLECCGALSVEDIGLGKLVQVHNVVTHSGAAVRHTGRHCEHTERDVLDGEVVVRAVRNPRHNKFCVCCV